MAALRVRLQDALLYACVFPQLSHEMLCAAKYQRSGYTNLFSGASRSENRGPIARSSCVDDARGACDRLASALRQEEHVCCIVRCHFLFVAQSLKVNAKIPCEMRSVIRVLNAQNVRLAEIHRHIVEVVVKVQ
jgi:hypothetical protein